MFARFGDAKDLFLVASNDIAFLDGPAFDGTFNRTIPYIKEDLSPAARFERLGGERIIYPYIGSART